MPKYAFYYKLLINKRVVNKRNILGNIYLKKTQNKKTKIAKVKTTWLKKKNGTNCGILSLEYTIAQKQFFYTNYMFTAHKLIREAVHQHLNFFFMYILFVIPPNFLFR